MKPHAVRLQIRATATRKLTEALVQDFPSIADPNAPIYNQMATLLGHSLDQKSGKPGAEDEIKKAKDEVERSLQRYPKVDSKSLFARIEAIATEASTGRPSMDALAKRMEEEGKLHGEDYEIKEVRKRDKKREI